VAQVIFVKMGIVFFINLLALTNAHIMVKEDAIVQLAIKPVETMTQILV
jgi:hypothetical protein